jgi:hypothetical protein
MIPNANVVTSSLDRISGSVLAPNTQAYNNFRIQTSGANIIQGQINKFSLTELMFPYDIPTVITGVNDQLFIGIRILTIAGDGSVINPENPTEVPVTIPPGFYTATEMASTINTELGTIATGLTCTLNAVENCLSFNNINVWNATPGGNNYVYNIYPGSLLGVLDAKIFNKPQLLWTLGFRTLLSNFPVIPCATPPTPPAVGEPLGVSLVPLNTPIPVLNAYCPNGGVQAITGVCYSGAFTNYIDIVSPSLTQAQYVRDSTTSQGTAKKDVIARVYVCDNVSLATSNNVGSRPFVIYRIFPCPKVMKWTVDRSLDAIQLELYDMYGLPLPPVQTYTGQVLGAGATQLGVSCRDYAITLHIHEPDETMEPNVGYKY